VVPSGRHRLPFAAALLAVVVLPAAAQQAPPTVGQRLVLPAPAAPDWNAVGKPRSPDPGASALPSGEPLLDCGRDLPCRVRLRGVLGRNGGVAVEGTAFTW
jgi:hypothetical protein